MKQPRERKPMRLPSYDYSMPGAYFVTACTKNREFLFESPEAKLAVVSAWQSVLDIFSKIELDEFVVMPNHIHGIVCITGEGAYRLHRGTWKNSNRRDDQLVVPTKEIKYETLSHIIGAFKTTGATRINKLHRQVGFAVWQKSFYDLSFEMIVNWKEYKNTFEIIQESGMKIAIILPALNLICLQNP